MEGGFTKLELSPQRNVYFTPSRYHGKSQAQVKICQEGRAENTILVTRQLSSFPRVIWSETQIPGTRTLNQPIAKRYATNAMHTNTFSTQPSKCISPRSFESWFMWTLTLIHFFLWNCFDFVRPWQFYISWGMHILNTISIFSGKLDKFCSSNILIYGLFFMHCTYMRVAHKIIFIWGAE